MGMRSILAVVVLLGVRTAGAVDVIECGQVIPPGEVGELRQHLDCTGQPTWPFYAQGVRLHPGATLALNGFRIAGDGSGVGVDCMSTGRGPDRCAIEGPGEVRGFYAGVNCGGCRMAVQDVIFRANTNGIYIPLAGQLVAERVVASDNTEIGIWASGVRGSDIEASRNGSQGLVANGRLRVRRVDATANGGPGIVGGAKSSHVKDSVVTDNDAAGDGYDIQSTGPVRLTRTTCGRSAKLRYVSQEEFKIVGSFGCAND
jgi:hypothetical protein